MNTRAELVRAFAERAKSHGLAVTVPADGSFHAHIAIVGEAPGEREVSTRIPFSGGAGKVLWDALRKHDISRQDVYITNVLKRQVSLGPAQGDEHIHASRGELQHWYELVRWELEQLPNVKYVLLLGNYALEAFTGETGITKWRGSVWPGRLLTRDVHFVATFNPAMVLREPKTAITFNFDINKLNRVMTGKFHLVEIAAHINPSYDDAVEWIHKMQYDARHGSPIAFDIEVIANETACVGLASCGTEGMCINFRGMNDNRYTLEQERELRKYLSVLLSDEKVRLVAQNGQFDAYWMWYKDRIRVRDIWFDTLLAHHTLYPMLPHNLGFLTAQYTDHPYYKDEGKTWREEGDIDAFWRYNVKDACITHTVQKREQVELTTQGLDSFFFNHVMRLQPKLIRSTVLGVRCDVALKEYIKEQLTEDTSKLLADFHNAVHVATGDTTYCPNPKSPKQLSELFFYKLKLIGRGTATDAANRKRMRAHPRTPPAARDVIDALDRYAKEHKFLTTYAEMVIDPDGRIRAEFKQFGTQSAPGRLSSSKTLWGSGMNLQNQPRRAQAMFVADKGYGFGYFDLSQAEARYVAWDAYIESWMEQFERARIDGQYDAHRALASDMFNVPYDEVPRKDIDANGAPTIRYIAKRCRHGLNYRMGADKLAEVTGLTAAQAESAYEIYHSRTPQLRTWWDAITREVRRTKMLHNSLGRRLMFLERLDDSALESVVAFRPQSTIGDKVCQVWYQSEDDPSWPSSARICLNIHDALICLAPLNKVKTCLSIMKRYAESPIPVQSIVTGRTNMLVIPVETKMSTAIAWTVDAAGQLQYVEREDGQHRWYGMKPVDVEAA